MKIAGLEYRLWAEGRKPEGFRIEHATLEAERDGELLIADDELVDAGRLGVLVWDGDAELDPTGGRGISVSKAIREARRQESDAVLLISAPKGKLDALAALLRAEGAHILNR